jgi:hypothetical protein
MRPLAGTTGVDGAGSATTTAGTKPDFSPAGPSASVQNTPIQQQRPRNTMSPRRRRYQAWRLHTLQNDLQLLVIRPAPPPASFNNPKPINLSTELIAVHKDCYKTISPTRQGGLHRRKTFKRQ